uniref:V-type proton ATPase subunit G n=1 Tax=Heterorhabditis bacteriophora TaxID=37862 RepID=A0A1I7WDI7_HETBA
MGARMGSDYRAKKDQTLIAAAEKQRDRAVAEAAENLRAANACGQLLQD